MIEGHSSVLRSAGTAEAEASMAIVLSLDLDPWIIRIDVFEIFSAYEHMRTLDRETERDITNRTSLKIFKTAWLASPSRAGAETQSSTASSETAVTPSRLLSTPGLTRHWMCKALREPLLELIINAMAFRADMSSWELSRTRMGNWQGVWPKSHSRGQLWGSGIFYFDFVDLCHFNLKSHCTP
jgi:hypothetical protein